MSDKLVDETKATIITNEWKFMMDQMIMQEEMYKEKRLWRNIDIPCSLAELLNGLTRKEINRIRRSFKSRVPGSLKKAEMISELAGIIPAELNEVLHKLDYRRYRLIKSAVQNSGILRDFDLSIEQIEMLQKSGVLYPGTYQNQRVLYMPPEILNAFLTFDDADLKNKIRRNTEWLLLTQGMLYYYGLIRRDLAREKIGKLTGKKVDPDIYYRVLYSASCFYNQIQFCYEGLFHRRLFGFIDQIEEHQKRLKIDHYPFTREQLLKAGEPGYVLITPAVKNLMHFLSKYYPINEQIEKQIAGELTERINRGESLPAILKYILHSSKYIPSSPDYIPNLTELVMDLYNNTPQWKLKGNTPDQVSLGKKLYLKLLPEFPCKEEKQPDAKMIFPGKIYKVAFNDPCPCNSGSIYKKCCGN